MARVLPLKADLRYLREEAKDLLKSHRRGEVAACGTLKLHHRFRGQSDEDILGQDVSLQEMQHALALDYGFKSWRDLSLHVKRMPAVVDVADEFRKRGNKAAPEVAVAAVKDGATLDRVFAGVASREKKVKNAAALALRIISETHPECITPRIGVISELLDGSDNILKWNATQVVGNLAGADVAQGPDERLIEQLLRLSVDGTMITAANAVMALGAVAAGRPEFRERITSALLVVDRVERNPECRNILIGRVIDALGRYVEQLPDPEPIVEYVRGNLGNSRNSTRKRAEKFLRDCRKRSVGVVRS